MTRPKSGSVEEYLETAPVQARVMLVELREILRKVAPDATESLKWGSPVFEQGRILFSYTAYKSHINFMPTAPALEPFLDELSGFKMGKDTVQLPYNKPLPKILIQKIATFRLCQVKEQDARWRHKSG